MPLSGDRIAVERGMMPPRLNASMICLLGNLAPWLNCGTSLADMLSRSGRSGHGVCRYASPYTIRASDTALHICYALAAWQNCDDQSTMKCSVRSSTTPIPR